jgi:hypothetical protein
MHDQISPQRQGLLQNWRTETIIHNETRTMAMSDISQSSEISQYTQWV